MRPDVNTHKVDSKEVDLCSGALGAGIMLARIDERKGQRTAGTDTYAGATCKAPETYSSIDALLAAEKARLAKGSKQPIEAFALPAQSSNKMQGDQVKDAISGIEQQLGYGSGKLNYVWFNDENGKAEVFLLGRATKESDLQTQKVTATESCVNFDSLVDNSENLVSNVPLGTTEGALGNILKERRKEADLVKLGLPTNFSDVDVQAVKTDRLLQIEALENRLPAPENRSAEQTEQLSRNKSAIEIGLPAGSTDEEIKQMKDSQNLQIRAIMLGLDQQSSTSDIHAVEERIDATPDTDLNESLGLPAQTTRHDALAEDMKRLKDAELLEQGLSPDMTPEQIKKIQNERNEQIREIQSKALFADDPAERITATNAIENIKIGLPADSSVETYTETMEKYHLQFMAVSSGLNRDASQAKIDEAQKRSNRNVPENLCAVN